MGMVSPNFPEKHIRELQDIINERGEYEDALRRSDLR